MSRVDYAEEVLKRLRSRFLWILMVTIGYFYPQWRSYGVASIIGLGVGSTIIGFVVWAYSQVFVLPASVGGVPITAIRRPNLANMDICN
ncbi:MAG: hypothetical protein QXX99_03020 [Candidatus Bathyarchaeia archaeon]